MGHNTSDIEDGQNDQDSKRNVEQSDCKGDTIVKLSKTLMRIP